MTRTPQTAAASVPPTAAAAPADAIPPGVAGTSPPAFPSQESPRAGGDPAGSAVAVRLALTATADQTPPGVGRRRAAGAAPGGSNPIAAAMSETQFEQAVRRIIKDLGLLAYHTFDSRRSAGGFPDWVIVGPGGVLFRELKTEKGKVTDAQAQWLRALVRAGQDACVWRPRDLLSGLVARRLAKLAGIEAA